MNRRDKLTQKELKEVLHYDPETGIFTRKIRTANCTHVGDVVGSITMQGYLTVAINKISYPLHRLAFLYMTGKFPENDVDHINRIRDDNRWCNLRELSRQNNSRNASLRSFNYSGIIGVHQYKSTKKWVAQIGVDAKPIVLGHFFTKFDAAKARLEAEKKYGVFDVNDKSTAALYIEKHALEKRKFVNLIYGDCIKEMKKIPNESIDLILTDPPYGTTACKWDSIIPLKPMWEQLTRIINKNGAIVMTASQPFTTKLISSNMDMFKYCWVWEKNFSTNFLHAKRQPLRKTEDIVVWHKGSSFYYPIKTSGHPPTQSATGSSNGVLWHGNNKRNYAGGDTDRYPTNIIRVDAHDPKNRLHPTQKPVELMEYLIKTYTKEGEMVLDFAMGSGTTGVACKNLNRKFIGIEKDEKYFEICKERLN